MSASAISAATHSASSAGAPESVNNEKVEGILTTNENVVGKVINNETVAESLDAASPKLAAVEDILTPVDRGSNIEIGMAFDGEPVSDSAVVTPEPAAVEIDVTASVLIDAPLTDDPLIARALCNNEVIEAIAPPEESITFGFAEAEVADLPGADTFDDAPGA